NAVSNGQLKSTRVRFEVVTHLVLRRKRERGRWKLHPHEAVEDRRRKQTKRVPALAPRVAHPLTGVEDDERTTLASQVVPDGESPLPAADHNGVKCLLNVLLSHAHLTAAIVVNDRVRPHRPNCAARRTTTMGISM